LNKTYIEFANGAIYVNNAGVITKVIKEDNLHICKDKGVIKLEGNQFLIPGLVDTHIHASQYAYDGAGLDLQLIDWLNTYTFPEESKFGNLSYAREIYNKVVDRLIISGTTFASYYGTIYLNSTKLLFDIVNEKGQRALVGKVNMDRNAPDYYIETTNSSLRDTEEYINYCLSRESIVKPVITPRFVPTCSNDLMKGLGGLAKKYNTAIQTHLDENFDEIAWVQELEPEYSSYTDVYDKMGLLGSKSIMAHFVHPTPAEVELLSERNAGVALCPNSNWVLRSGSANYSNLISKVDKLGLGTDMSGGYSPSIFEQMRTGYFVGVSNGITTGTYDFISFDQLFYLATIGGAKVLGNEKLGNFKEGNYFDALIIDPNIKGSSIDIFAEDNVQTIFQKFINNGDSRNIIDVYVNGRIIHSKRENN
jgi:guanine deaminase